MTTPQPAGYVTDVSYIPGFYANLAPVAMRHVAALNKVVPPRVADGYRYLELGCGLGRSLTTLAAADPRGDFTGVDMNPEHTAFCRREIAAGELANARVVTSDFARLPDDLRDFDFITLHGVWSWVAPEVRADILRIAAERLAPGGLLLVSYNAMPGWAHLLPIRGILRQYAALRQGDSARRVAEAVDYLAFVRDHGAKYFQDNPAAAKYVDTIRSQDPRYLAHEYLNEHWTSFYFSEVSASFGGAGLTYAGSLPVQTNFWDLCVAPGFQELFRTTSDRLVTEAHKDFCANTMFRWDLFARQPRALADAADRIREADDVWYRVARSGITLPWSVNLGVVTSTVQGPPYAALLEMLAGRGMRLSEIVADPRVGGVAPDDLVRAVDAGVAMRMFDCGNGPLVDGHAARSEAIRIPSAFNRQVLASDLLGGRGVPLASTVTGSAVTLGDFDAAILSELAAGGPTGLASRIDALLASRDRVLNHEGTPITDPAERLSRIESGCAAFRESVLPLLAAQGIVVAAD